MKMKIAVIIGVVHMILGVFMKALNSIHFKKWMDFFFEFVPQIIFLVL
jgi:V-type H+-transporting ATPase subunit a